MDSVEARPRSLFALNNIRDWRFIEFPGERPAFLPFPYLFLTHLCVKEAQYASGISG